MTTTSTSRSPDLEPHVALARYDAPSLRSRPTGAIRDARSPPRNLLGARPLPLLRGHRARLRGALGTGASLVVRDLDVLGGDRDRCVHGGAVGGLRARQISIARALSPASRLCRRRGGDRALPAPLPVPSTCRRSPLSPR